MVPAYLVPSRPERIPNTNDALLIGMKVWRDTEVEEKDSKSRYV